MDEREPTSPISTAYSRGVACGVGGPHSRVHAGDVQKSRDALEVEDGKEETWKTETLLGLSVAES
jgi:hypothetical protein